MLQEARVPVGTGAGKERDEGRAKDRHDDELKPSREVRPGVGQGEQHHHRARRGRSDDPRGVAAHERAEAFAEADAVERNGDRLSGEEDKTEGPAVLDPKGTGDHVVVAATADSPVGHDRRE